MRALSITIVLAALSAGCGGAAPSVAPEAGVESNRARPVIAGEPRSFVPAWTGIFARIDLERMRGSVNASGYASLARETHTYRHVFEDVGLDPVDDLDRAIIVSPTVLSSHTLLVVRHRLSTADIRARVDRETRERGGEPSWAYAPVWPCRSSITRRVVITAEHELVLAPDADVATIEEVALDHRARSPDGAIVEPGFAGAVDGEIARIWATSGIPGSQIFGGRSPLSADFLMREPGADRTDITLDLNWEDVATATFATAELRRLASLYAREPLLRGIAGILAAVRVEQRETHTIAFARLSDADLGSGLATATLLAQVWGWGS